MHLEKVDFLISSAEDMYKAAQKETTRSHEDAVTHLICYHSRQSIINYLQGFLLRNDVAPVTPATMAGLMHQCRDIDGRFELVNLTPINCRFETHDKDYCLEKDQVDSCFDCAAQIRNIVMTPAPGY